MPRNLPPLTALRAFEDTARHLSFTRAGDTLNLSQSAVSRQIRALEESLKVPLFHRHARGLKLTEQGETLLKTVREVYSKLAMAEAAVTDSLIRGRRAGSPRGRRPAHRRVHRAPGRAHQEDQDGRPIPDAIGDGSHGHYRPA